MILRILYEVCSVGEVIELYYINSGLNIYQVSESFAVIECVCDHSARPHYVLPNFSLPRLHPVACLLSSINGQHLRC